MCWRQNIPLLTELKQMDDGQAINISLLTELSINQPPLTSNSDEYRVSLNQYD
jgi:hypothetical protein